MPHISAKKNQSSTIAEKKSASWEEAFGVEGRGGKT